jgi:hypothetical protein
MPVKINLVKIKIDRVEFLSSKFKTEGAEEKPIHEFKDKDQRWPVRACTGDPTHGMTDRCQSRPSTSGSRRNLRLAINGCPLIVVTIHFFLMLWSSRVRFKDSYSFCMNLSSENESGSGVKYFMNLKAGS